MDWEQIEKRLSDHSNEQSYPVDTNELWQAVYPHLNKKKKRRGFLFFLLPAVLLIGIAALGLFSSDYLFNGDNNRPDTTITKSFDTAEKSTISSSISAKADNSLNLLSNDAELNESNDQAQIEQRSLLKSAIQTTIESNNQSLSTIEDKAVNRVYLNKNKTTDFISIELSDSDLISSQVPQSVVKRTSSSLAASQVDKSTSTILSSADQESTPLEDRLLVNVSMNPIILDIALLENQIFAVPTLPELVQIEPIFKSNRLKNQFYALITAGVASNYGIKSLIDPELADHYNNRAAAETDLLSFNTDIRLGYQLSRHWSLNVGLNYNKLFSRSRSTISFTRDITLDDAILQEIFTVDGVQQIRGTVNVVEAVTQQVSRINRYEQILLPLSVGYRNRFLGFLYDIEVGGAFSLSQSYSGYIHPFDDQEYSLDLDENDWYRSGPNIYMTVGAGLAYPFANNVELISGIKYWKQLNQINTNNYGIEERLSPITLSLGTRINF